MAIDHSRLAARAIVSRMNAELRDVGAEIADYHERLAKAETEPALFGLLEQAQYASGRYDGLKFAIDNFEDF